MSQVLTNIYDLYTPAATAPGAELVQRCKAAAQARFDAESAALAVASVTAHPSEERRREQAAAARELKAHRHDPISTAAMFRLRSAYRRRFER